MSYGVTNINILHQKLHISGPLVPIHHHDNAIEFLSVVAAHDYQKMDTQGSKGQDMFSSPLVWRHV